MELSCNILGWFKDNYDKTENKTDIIHTDADCFWFKNILECINNDKNELDIIGSVAFGHPIDIVKKTIDINKLNDDDKIKELRKQVKANKEKQLTKAKNHRAK